MPPKRADPEALKQDHQNYLADTEYKKIYEIRMMIRDLGIISQTSKDYDLDGKFQSLWDRLYELSQIMKIKPPFKKLEHQWMRSMFFGQKRKIDPTEKKCFYDGVICEFQPTDGDSQHNLRQILFKKIYSLIESEDNFDIDNYQKYRVEIKKGFQQFYSLMKVHSKKSFKIIYEEKLMSLLQPFTDLLEINMKLVLHDMKYTTKEDRFINNFKHKAIVDRYCVCLQKVIEILMTHHNKKVKFMIRPSNIFKKLAYENLSKIQSFYLQPYRGAFEALKQGLCALFATGINFWKVPLEQNKRFVDDLNKVIMWELICQRFFGNDLLRDQINFAANTLRSIEEANELAKKYLLKQDLNTIEISIPRLIAFKTILHMRNYKDKLQTIQNQERQRSKILNQTKLSNEHQHQQLPNNISVVNNSVINPSLITNNNASLVNTKQIFKGLDTHQTKTAQMQQSKVQSKVEFKIETEDERQKLGRYWIWQNYCDDEFKKNVIENASDMLKNINKAVYQDIQDSIIREGMLPRRDRQNQQLKSAADYLKNMKTSDNALRSQNMRRPPELWNFPKVVQENHTFRSIADPKKCYVDGRIQKLDDAIIKIADYLRNYNQKQWVQLIRRVIDFYDGKPDENPFGKVVVAEEMQQSQQLFPQ